MNSLPESDNTYEYTESLERRDFSDMTEANVFLKDNYTPDDMFKIEEIREAWQNNH